MAGTTKMKSDCGGDKKVCDIMFNGGIQSHIRAELVKELIKYFLYERQQIPMPFDQLKKQNDGGDKINANCKRKRFNEDSSHKKCNSLISSLPELLEQLESAFEVCPELCQILITFGGTVINPKETFLINLPPLTPESDTVSQKSSIKTLFRQLISEDILGGAKPISPTTMSVLILASRESGIHWFVPKPTFKTPSRGKQFVYNLVCKNRKPHEEVNCRTWDGANISGIEPLDVSTNEFADDDEISVINNQTLQNCTNATFVQEAEEIWYLAPIVIKGYLETLN